MPDTRRAEALRPRPADELLLRAPRTNRSRNDGSANARGGVSAASAGRSAPAAVACCGALAALIVSLPAGCTVTSEVGVFEPVPQSVAPTRLELLDRGFVATDWIEKKYVRGLYTSADLRTLKSAGIRNIRVPFGMGDYADASALMFQQDAPDTPNPDALANYDEILDDILGQGLAVVVTPADSDFRTWTDEGYEAKLIRFWRALGRHLATRDPARVFIKVAYDPTSGNPDAWYTVQRKLLAAVRESNPDRTFLVSPNAYTRLGERDPVKALEEMAPEGDLNAVYDVGFFMPVAFTLQGATWREEPGLPSLAYLPYPSSPEACATVIGNIGDAVARRVANGYCTYPYNRDTLTNLFADLGTWAASHHVHVSNAGFGVLRPHVDDASRFNWIADTRKGLEAQAIPWAFYNDLPDFTGLTGDAGARTFEPGVRRALFDP